MEPRIHSPRTCFEMNLAQYKDSIHYRNSNKTSKKWVKRLDFKLISGTWDENSSVHQCVEGKPFHLRLFTLGGRYSRSVSIRKELLSSSIIKFNNRFVFCLLNFCIYLLLIKKYIYLSPFFSCTYFKAFILICVSCLLYLDMSDRHQVNCLRRWKKM